MNIFTAFLKNKNIIFKIRRSKITDYAGLTLGAKSGIRFKDMVPLLVNLFFSILYFIYLSGRMHWLVPVSDVMYYLLLRLTKIWLTGFTPDMRQSKTILTIDICRPKTARNRPVGRQMALENSVSKGY